MRRLAALAFAGLLLAAFAGPVSASASVNDEGPFDWSADTCGIQTDIHFTGRLVVVKSAVVDDVWGGPTLLNVHDWFVYTNPANGRSATYDWFGKMTQTYVGQDETTGDITLLQTYYGLEARLKAGNGRVLAIDAGTLTLSTLWDASGSVQLGADLVAMKGPHPMVTSDTAFCDAMVAALS
jgi:hypothetical protein